MLQTIITSGIIYFAVLVVIFVTANQNKSSRNNVVKLHPAFLAIGVIGVAVSAAFAVLMVIMLEIMAVWVFTGISVLSSLLIFGYLNCRIFFDDAGMTCRNLFGKKTVIPYNEILYIDEDMDGVIQTAEEKITIYNYMTGRNELMSKIKNYKSKQGANNGSSAVRHTSENNTTVRKFNESVNRPSTVIFSYIVCIVLAIGIIAFLMYSLFTDSELKEDEFFVPFIVIGFAIAVFLVGYVVLAVYAAKRAHRSQRWHTIAEKLIPNGYLKDD